MIGSEICHVGHAAVSQFYVVVVVANFVQLMSGWKVHS